MKRTAGGDDAFEKEYGTLAVAQFITSFQSLFRKRGVKNTPISALNVTEAIKYEELLAAHSVLENEWQAMEKESLSKDEVDMWEKELENSRERLNKQREVGMEIHSLLRTFEVWSTKLLAKHLLMHSSTVKHSHGNETTEKQYCCSPLLNLPCAKLFQQIMPPIEGPIRESANEKTDINAALDKEDDTKSHACSLPLPPNSLTYYEYLRIAQMISLLPTSQAVNELCASPMSAVSAKLMPVREDLKLTETSKFTQADIVALWIRAQRSSSALRHLLHIFVVSEIAQKDTTDETNDVLSTQRSEKNGKNERSESKKTVIPNYVAKFIGNQKKTKTHVSVDTRLIDALVEWAVMNQTLFTFAHAKEMIRLSVLDAQRDRKRKIPLSFPSTVKRLRFDMSEEGLNILRGCHCFMLRWFARRNKKALSILFTTSNYQNNIEGSVNLILKELTNLNIPNMVKDYMAGIGSTDRTFARIDRRVHKNKYETHDMGNTEKQTFYNAVTQLLNALVTSVPINSQLPQTKILSAFTDFENIYQLYHQRFLDEGAKAAAQELIEVNPGDDTAGVLNSAPSPWLDRCSLCEKGWDSGSFVVCNNCETGIHEDCTVIRKFKVNEYLDAFKPLERVYGRRIPRNGLLPDFRNATDIIWETIELEVIKKVNQRGQLQSLGIGIRNTEQTETMFKNYILKTGTLDDMGISDNDFPLVLPHKGILVVDLAEGLAGAVAGIKKNDIITALEFLYSQDGRVVKEKHEFAPLTGAERTALCRRGIKQLKITVQRPNVDVIRLSKKWLRRSKKASLALRKAIYLESGSYRDMVICPVCSTPPQKEETTAGRIKWEATCCRAVIRRLGMEEYSLPFHDDGEATGFDSVEKDIRHYQYASFRRLDAMMSFIIDSCVPQNPITQPFDVPPWDTSKSRERISWAPKALEKKPLELLCRGIECLLTDPSLIYPSQQHTEDAYKEERAALSNDFISFFCTWCVAPSHKGVKIESRGPPLSAQRAKAPWLVESCMICGVRPRQTNGEGSIEPTAKFCNNPVCEQKYQAYLAYLKELEKKASLKKMKELKLDWAPTIKLPSSDMSRALREYEHYSSFVGTTLLVLPGDPLLEFVSRALNWSIEHMDRPVLLVVASYLPGCLTKSGDVNSDNSRSNLDRAGEFHVLPVLHDTQMKFLLSICKMREPPESEDLDANEKSWLNLEVLNVEGIIRLSPTELKQKIEETAAIRQAVDEAVAKIAMCTNKAELKKMIYTEPYRQIDEKNTRTGLLVPCRAVELSKISLRGESEGKTPDHSLLLDKHIGGEYTGFVSKEKKSENEFQGGSDGSALKRYATIIDSLLSSEEPVMRDLLEQSLDVEKRVLGEKNGYNGEEFLDPGDDTDVGENEIGDWASTSRSRKLWHNIGVQADSFWKSDGPIKTQSVSREKVDSFHNYMSSFMKLSLGYCQLCYSDLFMDDSQLTRGGNIRNWLNGQKFTYPGPISDGDTIYDTILKRNAVTGGSSGEVPYNGIGWGFELVVWKNESAGIRVGRVYPHSPAAKGGFRMHDILVSINGKNLQSLSSVPELSCLLLGCDHKAVSGTSLAEIVNSIGMGTGGKAIGPIFVRVRRCANGGKAFPPHVSNEVSNKRSRKQNGVSEEVSNKRSPSQHGHDQNSTKWAHKSMQHPKLYNNLANVTSTATAAGTPVPARAVLTRPAQPNTTIIQHQQVQTTQAPVLAHSNYSKPCSVEPIFTHRDLYRVGLKGSYLSRVETAFVLEARKRNCPKLGVRLLVPRYDSDMISSEVTKIYSTLIEAGKIPNLQEDLWTFVLKYDYKRAKDETGPIWFSEGSYSYRYPISVLPLDRLTEGFLKQSENLTPPPGPTNPYTLEEQRKEHLNHEIGQNGTTGFDATSRPGRSMPRPHQMLQTAHGPSTETASYQNSGPVVDLGNYDEACQRIRGGGDAPEESAPSAEMRSKRSPVKCNTLAAKDLAKALVWGECHTLKDNKESGDAKLIGFVHNPEPKDAATGDIDVALIYVSNAGHLEEPIIERINSSFLYKVEKGSEEEMIANEWQDEQKWSTQVEGKVQSPPKLAKPAKEAVESKKIHSNCHDATDPPRTNGNDINGTRRNETEVAQLANEQEQISRNPLGKITLNDAARLLVERFCNRKAEPRHLGNLPDGQAVFWLQSDPRALYLRKPSLDEVGSTEARLSASEAQRSYRAQISQDSDGRQKKALPAIQLCEQGTHCCIWGCTVNVESNGKLRRQVLSFKTVKALENHLATCHSFNAQEQNKVTGMGSFTRIGEGKIICELAADITSSICARCLSFTSYATQIPLLISNGDTSDGLRFSRSVFELGSRITFSPEKLLRLNEEGRGALDLKVLNRILDGSRKGESTVRRVLRLWSRIARLFDVENLGFFRLTEFDCKTNLLDKESTSLERDKPKHALCASENDCKDFSSQDRAFCQICCLDAEPVLFCRHSSKKKSGIGCALITELCFPPGETSNIFESPQIQLGMLGTVKKLLLRVASHVPPSLCQMTVSGTTGDVGNLACSEYSIWFDPYFDRWTDFVESSRDVRMLAQGFSLLLSSLNKTKLPTWWKSTRGGWSDAYSLMSSASFSSLALQLYILDAAIAETIALHSPAQASSRNDKENNPSAEQLRNIGTIEEKMKIVMQWAKELSLKQYSGEYNETCVQCSDGGTLMCCEFCSNVQHMYCCFPPVLEEPKFDWVCDSCIHDITELRNQSTL